MLQARISTTKLLTLVVAVLALLITNQVLARKSEGENKNIVLSVVSAPVVANGLVAGEPTEINILLRAKEAADALAMDPARFGHQIPQGGRMEVHLGGKFLRNTDAQGSAVVFPVVANQNIILTTAPQNPIVASKGDGVQHGNWRVEDDGANTLMIFPNGGREDNGIEGERAKKIGVKVIHIRPNPDSGNGPAVFINGAAGMVGTVSVKIFDKEGELVESGFGDVVFQSSVGRQVHITNAGLTTGAQGNPATVTTELVESTNFQHVGSNTELSNIVKTQPFSAGAPYAPRFLLFESIDGQADSFIPQQGIANVGYIVDPDRPWVAKLVENANTVIGAIVISGPSMYSRGMILPSDQLTTATGNGSVLSVPVKTGSKRGIYTVTLTLVNGATAVNTIVVE